jgi:hypothetical protein
VDVNSIVVSKFGFMSHHKIFNNLKTERSEEKRREEKRREEKRKWGVSERHYIWGAVCSHQLTLVPRSRTFLP